MKHNSTDGVAGTLPSLRWDGHEVWGDFTSLEAVREAVRANGAKEDQRG